MDHVKISGHEHDFQQAGDTAQHVDADLQTLAVTDQLSDLLDQCADRSRRVVHPQTGNIGATRVEATMLATLRVTAGTGSLSPMGAHDLRHVRAL
jgi:hypothetical protein